MTIVSGGKQRSFWIFQGSPDVFDIDKYVGEYEEITWTVTRYRKEIKVGDQVILWRSGENAAVLALCRVTEEPREDIAEDAQHLWVDPTKAKDSRARCRLKILRRVTDRPLLRQQVKDALPHLSIIKSAQGTNFRIGEEDYEVILTLLGEDPTLIPEEVKNAESLYEGSVRTITVNAYERSSVARKKCIRHYGHRCSICDLSLSDKYGEAAEGLIHVHHLRQLSEINAEYQVDPVHDLRPVCPNCHAVVHASSPALSIEQVRSLIEAHTSN